MQYLKKNAQSNHLSNIFFNQIGLWNKDNKILTMKGEDALAEPNEILETSHQESETYGTITIDSYAKSMNIPELNLIFLDIEGGELNVLKGATLFLSLPKESAPHLIFEIHRSFVDWSDGLEKCEIIQFLADHGYILYALRDYQSNVAMGDKNLEFVPIDNIYLQGPPHGFNIFATKKTKWFDDENLIIRSGISPKLLLHRDPKLHAPLS
jgi:FkbM family methyltransferase